MGDNAFPLILVKEHYGYPSWDRRVHKLLHEYRDYDNPELNPVQYLIDAPKKREPSEGTSLKQLRWKVNNTMNEYRVEAHTLRVGFIVDGLKIETRVHFHNNDIRSFKEWTETDVLVRSENGNRLSLTNGRVEHGFFEQPLIDNFEMNLE